MFCLLVASSYFVNIQVRVEVVHNIVLLNLGRFKNWIKDMVFEICLFRYARPASGKKGAIYKESNPHFCTNVIN